MPGRDCDVRSWIVLAAAFFSNFLNGGFLQIMGVYMVAWQAYFVVDASAIASVASIMSLMTRLSGVLSGALCKRFGSKSVLMVSGIVSVLATFLGSFVTTLWQLHIYAFFAGLGYGMSYTPSFIAVSSRFKARLGLANGILGAGAGVGILTMAPVIEFLCDEYGWKGSLLIHSGITAHRVALALLLKPSTLERKTLQEYQLERSRTTRHRTDQNDKAFLDKEQLAIEEGARRTDHQVPDDEEAKLVYQDGPLTKEPLTVHVFKGTETFNADMANRELAQLENANGISTEGLETCRPTLRCLKCMSFFKNIDRSFDLSYLARSPGYLFFLGSLFLTSTSTLQCRFYILPKLVYDLDVPRIKASFAMTILGACNTVIRALHGLLLDSGWISLSGLFLMALALAGTTLLINPFVESFIGQMVLAGFFGLGDALVLPLSGLLTKELVRPEKLANAIGMQYALGGVGMFVGIQIMGRLYDVTGSYDTPFLVFGVIQWTALVILFYLTKCSIWKPTSPTFSKN